MKLQETTFFGWYKYYKQIQCERPQTERIPLANFKPTFLN